MEHQFTRTELLLGEAAIKKLQGARVAVFGVGGVGGYVVEALARSGVGAFDLIDNDAVCLSNLNRQIIALHNTIGEYKVDAARERILQINPAAIVKTHRTFYLPETADQFDFTRYDYVVDAIDTVTGKIQLVMAAKACGTPVISSMGAGNKMDATAFKVADIYETNVCPLAKVMRRELKKRNIKDLKVVYSEEKPLTPIALPKEDMDENPEIKERGKRQIPGSIGFVPSVVGLIIAGEVIKDLIGYPIEKQIKTGEKTDRKTNKNWQKN